MSNRGRGLKTHESISNGVLQYFATRPRHIALYHGLEIVNLEKNCVLINGVNLN